jgi:hypothetical protein
MSKFNVGDKVRVVSITDIDCESSDPERVLTDPTNPLTHDWQNPAVSFIGQVGEVVDATMCDYYDISVHFEWMAGEHDVKFGDQPVHFGPEVACFKYDDVELIEK